VIRSVRSSPETRSVIPNTQDGCQFHLCPSRLHFPPLGVNNMQYVWLGVISDHPWLVAIVCGCGAVLSGWRFLLSVRSVRWAFGHRCVRCGHPPAGERCSECGAAEGLPRRHVRKSVCHSVLWCAGLVMLCWSTVILLKLKMWEFVSPETAVRVAFAGGARNDEWIKKIRYPIKTTF
jgi:hypothetical protein